MTSAEGDGGAGVETLSLVSDVQLARPSANATVHINQDEALRQVGDDGSGMAGSRGFLIDGPSYIVAWRLANPYLSSPARYGRVRCFSSLAAYRPTR